MPTSKKTTLIRLGSARRLTLGSQGNRDEPVIGARFTLPG
jgi:hypothetical protein